LLCRGQLATPQVFLSLPKKNRFEFADPCYHNPAKFLRGELLPDENGGKHMSLRDIRKIRTRTKLAAALGSITIAAIAAVFTLPSVAQRNAADPTAPTTGAAEVSGADPLKSVAGVLSRFDGVDATDNPCTSSASYVNMPGMSKTFFQSATDDVVVMFQGEWISGTGRALLRLTVDNVVQPGPGDGASPFAPHEGSGVATNGFNFISNPIGAGNHTARIQWATTNSQVCVDERSMVVLHR
jgi:hypothetical protein